MPFLCGKTRQMVISPFPTKLSLGSASTPTNLYSYFHSPVPLVSTPTKLYSCYLGPVTIDVISSNGMVTMESTITVLGQTFLCKPLDVKEHDLLPLNFTYEIEYLRGLAAPQINLDANLNCYYLSLHLRKRIAILREENSVVAESDKFLSGISPTPEISAYIDFNFSSSSIRNVLHSVGQDALLFYSLADLLEAHHAVLIKNVSVDALFNMVSYLEFMATTFNTVDGICPINTMITLVNIENLDNAFMNGGYFSAGNGQNYFTPLVSIDVMGHEIAHSLTEQRAGLMYEGHSGALNESYSDILGTGLEGYLYNKLNNNEDKTDDIMGVEDFILGEDFGKNVRFIRDMSDPNRAQDPAIYKGQYWANPNNFDNDYGGVHTNSGVWNHCFYLVQEKVGLIQALQWFFQVLLELTPRSNYMEARDRLKIVSNGNLDVLNSLNQVGLTDQAISDQTRDAKPKPKPKPKPKRKRKPKYPKPKPRPKRKRIPPPKHKPKPRRRMVGLK